MSAKKTPRGLISDYLDASKTQMDSHHRRMAKSIPRTPDTYSQSVERVLPHSRVASLRSKRRSVSSYDEEDTPRQLIAQYLATADTTAPLVRHGRRTSQSAVFASQPAIPVSNKRQRRSSPRDDMSIDQDTETPRTLINRYLQNVSQTVETPVVRRHSMLHPASPENPMVQDTYSTPSPFKESSAGSVSSVRKSARKLIRLSRSATKSNYSLVIPESQGFSSPSTDKFGTQQEFHMPSPFQSSDTEEEEEEMPAPDRSRYTRTRHVKGGYNLTVPESVLEEMQMRDQSDHEIIDRQRIQSIRDETGSHRDQSEYQETNVYRDRSLINQSVDGDGDRQKMEEEEEGGRDFSRQEEYRLYDLPLQEPDNESYENIFRVSDSSLSHQDQNFSAKLLTVSHRTEREIIDEEEEDEMRESLSRRSSHAQSTTGRDFNGRSPSARRPHSFGATRSPVSQSRSPRRSEPQPGHRVMAESSPIVSGRLYQRGQQGQEHIHSIAEQFSPRISSTQQTMNSEPLTREPSPIGTVTPSPVVSPERDSHRATPESSGGRSSGRRSTTPRSGSKQDYTGTLRSRSNIRTPNKYGQEHIHSIAEQFSPRISSTQRTMNSEPLTREPSPIGTVTPSPVVSPERDSHRATPESSGGRSSGRRSTTPRSGSKQDYTGTPRSRSNVTTPNEYGRTNVTRNLQSYMDGDQCEMTAVSNNSATIPSVSVSVARPTTRSASRPTSRSSNMSFSSTPRSTSRSRFATPSTSSKVLTGRKSGTTTPTTPRSKVASPSSTNRKSSRRSLRSPVVAGRMGRHQNKDLVHTLPNLTSNFSPQIASTQNPVSISRLTPEQETFDVPEDEVDPREDDMNKENDGHMINPAEEEEGEEWQDMEVDAAKSRHEKENEGDNTSKKTQKVTRKPRKQNPYGIPINLVKKRISHYAGMRFDKDAIKCVMDISEKYWDNLATDLTAYAKHAGRKRINMEDIVLLFKRQGHVNEKQSLTSLIEKYMPYEEREKLIPCARAFNKVELNRKGI